MESIDYHQLPRRELQSLCKKHGIPANKKNSYMADALASLFKGNQSGQNCTGDALASTSDESDRVEQSEEEQPEDISDEVLKNHSSELIDKGEFETHGCNATATCNSDENQEEYHYCEADTSIPDQVVNKENILLTKTAGIHVESSDKTPSKKELETTEDLMKDISTDKLQQEAIGKSGIPVPSNSDADNKEVDLSGSLTNDESVITPSEAIKDDNSTDEFHQQAISNFGTQVTSKTDAVSNEVNLSVDEYTVSSSQAIKDAQIQEMSQASTLTKMGIENCSMDKEVVMSSHLTFDESSVSPSQPLKETQIKEKSQASSITRIEIANCFVEKALQLTDNLESPICKQQVISGTANNESSFEGNIKESSSHNLELTDSKYLSDYTRKPSDSNTDNKGLQDAAEGREGRHSTDSKSLLVGIEEKNVNNCPVSDPTEEFEDCLETSVEGNMDMDMCPEDTKQSSNNVTVPSQVEESTDMQTDNNVQKASFCHIKAFKGEEATRVDYSKKLNCSNLQADDNKDVALNDQLPVENNNKEDNDKCCISHPIVDVDMLAADSSSQGSEFQHSGPSTDILAKRRAVRLYQNENSQPISSNLIDGSNLNKNAGSQVTSNSSVNKDLKDHTAEICRRSDIFSSRVAESQDFSFFKAHPEEHYPVPFMTPGPKISNKLEDSGDNSQCKSVGAGERKQKLLTRFLKKALEESVERQRTKKMQSTEGEQSTPMQKPSAFGDISSILDSDNAGPEGFADPSKKRKDVFKTPIFGKSKAKSLETARLMSLSNRAKLFNSRRGISSENLVINRLFLTPSLFI